MPSHDSNSEARAILIFMPGAPEINRLVRTLQGSKGDILLLCHRSAAYGSQCIHSIFYLAHIRSKLCGQNAAGS